MIHVIAVIIAKPGMRDAVLSEFRANMPAVHAEQGRVEYAPAIGPDTFVAVENWESAEALKAHAAAPHMKAYAAKTKDMIASRLIHVLSPAD